MVSAFASMKKQRARPRRTEVAICNLCSSVYSQNGRRYGGLLPLCPCFKVLALAFSFTARRGVFIVPMSFWYSHGGYTPCSTTVISIEFNLIYKNAVHDFGNRKSHTSWLSTCLAASLSASTIFSRVKGERLPTFAQSQARREERPTPFFSTRSRASHFSSIPVTFAMGLLVQRTGRLARGLLRNPTSPAQTLARRAVATPLHLPRSVPSSPRYVSSLANSQENATDRETITRLLYSLASRKEVERYLRIFSAANKFAVLKVGGAILTHQLDELALSLSFLHRV